MLYDWYFTLSFTDEGVNLTFIIFIIYHIIPFSRKITSKRIMRLNFISCRMIKTNHLKPFIPIHNCHVMGKRSYSTNKSNLKDKERLQHIQEFEPLLPKNLRINPLDIPESKDFALIFNWLKLEYPNINFKIKTYFNLYSASREIFRDFKGIGIYIFTSKSGKILLVGESLNVGNRAVTYFRHSYLNLRKAPSLKYFHCYGFNNINLTLV